jgi:hypothetical protein
MIRDFWLSDISVLAQRISNLNTSVFLRVPVPPCLQKNPSVFLRGSVLKKKKLCIALCHRATVFYKKKVPPPYLAPHIQ